MSAKLIRAKAWLCTCLLPNCPGKGEPWTSLGDSPPDRCRWCKRRTWNRKDQRVKGKKMNEAELRNYNRQKQAESRARRKAEE